MKKDTVDQNTESVKIFADGSKRTQAKLESAVIGRGTFLPGWRWSEHVGKLTGKTAQTHIGYIISGEMMILNAQGEELKVSAGEAFEVGPGHDAWVIGDVSCVALDFTSLKEE